MQNQKALKRARDGASRNILYSPTIDEYQANVKQVNSSLDSSQNEANAILAKSFIKIRELEQAVNILAAVGIDEILAAFIVTVLGGVQV